MKTDTITITWDEIGGIGAPNRARIIQPSRGPDAMGGRVTIEACGTATLPDGRSYRVICHRYAPRPLSGEKVTDSVQLLRDGRNLPESNLPAVRAAALRAFRTAYSMAAGCDWNTAAANWPLADNERGLREASERGAAIAAADSDLGPRPSAEIVQTADELGSLAVLEYDCGAVYFPDDAHALRSWINDKGLTNPVFWTRPAVDIPLTRSALPVSKESAETWAAAPEPETVSPVAEIRRVGTIDLTPTWRGLLPGLLAVVADGTGEGRRVVREEMERMADAADRWNAACKVSPVAIVPDPDAPGGWLISGHGWEVQVYPCGEADPEHGLGKHYLNGRRDGQTGEVFESRLSLAAAIGDAVSLCARDGKWPAALYACAHDWESDVPCHLVDTCRKCGEQRA